MKSGYRHIEWSMNRISGTTFQKTSKQASKQGNKKIILTISKVINLAKFPTVGWNLMIPSHTYKQLQVNSVVKKKETSKQTNHTWSLWNIVWRMGEEVKETGLGGGFNQNKCIEWSHNKILRLYEVLHLIMKVKLLLEEIHVLVCPVLTSEPL